MSTQKISLTASATDEEIQECKKQVQTKYGATATIFKYKAEDGKVAFLRSVDRDTYSAAVNKLSTSSVKFNETIIENIWLGGDEEIKKVDRYFFGLVEFIEQLMAKKKGSLQEL